MGLLLDTDSVKVQNNKKKIDFIFLYIPVRIGSPSLIWLVQGHYREVHVPVSLIRVTHPSLWSRPFWKGRRLNLLSDQLLHSPLGPNYVRSSLSLPDTAVPFVNRVLDSFYQQVQKCLGIYLSKRRLLGLALRSTLSPFMIHEKWQRKKRKKKKLPDKKDLCDTDRLNKGTELCKCHTILVRPCFVTENRVSVVTPR